MTKQARGIRNHNPGNIRLSADKWQGLADQQADKDFFTFKEATYGIRALARLLINYQDKYSLRTIRQIIERWAPPVENDTKAYIASVMAETGFGADEQLDMHDFRDLQPIVEAIILHENGAQPYTDAQITKGLVLAGVEPPKEDKVTQSRTVKGAQVAGGATALSVVAESVNAVAPAFPLLSKVAEYAPIVLGIVALAAIGYIVWARIDDRRKGLR